MRQSYITHTLFTGGRKVQYQLGYELEYRIGYRAARLATRHLLKPYPYPISRLGALISYSYLSSWHLGFLKYMKSRSSPARSEACTHRASQSWVGIALYRLAHKEIAPHSTTQHASRNGWRVLSALKPLLAALRAMGRRRGARNRVSPAAARSHSGTQERDRGRRGC